MIQDIAPHSYEVLYKTSNPKDEDIILFYREGKLLCRLEEGKISYPTFSEVKKSCPQLQKRARFLFQIDGCGYFEPQDAETEDCILEESAKFTYVSKEELRELVPLVQIFAGITGFQIHKWYQENRFCSKCGGKMEHHAKERAMQCKTCGRLVYPTISPSVIVGVINKDKILLTKYQREHSKYQKYALVAGYVEVGESLEDTVRREVLEEVGLRVKNIRYYKSQPWSFTDTLLAGYFCEVDGSDKITLEEDELSEAGWFMRDQLPEKRSESSISLTGEMMEAFRDGLV